VGLAVIGFQLQSVLQYHAQTNMSFELEGQGIGYFCETGGEKGLEGSVRIGYK